MGCRCLSGRAEIPRSELSSTSVYGHVSCYGDISWLGIMRLPKQQVLRGKPQITLPKTSLFRVETLFLKVVHNLAVNCSHPQYGAAPFPHLLVGKLEGDAGRSFYYPAFNSCRETRKGIEIHISKEEVKTKNQSRLAHWVEVHTLFQ